MLAVLLLFVRTTTNNGYIFKGGNPVYSGAALLKTGLL